MSPLRSKTEIGTPGKLVFWSRSGVIREVGGSAVFCRCYTGWCAALSVKMRRGGASFVFDICNCLLAEKVGVEITVSHSTVPSTKCCVYYNNLPNVFLQMKTLHLWLLWWLLLVSLLGWLFLAYCLSSLSSDTANSVNPNWLRRCPCCLLHFLMDWGQYCTAELYISYV